MTNEPTGLLSALIKLCVVAIAFNEVRGLILSTPVFITLWQSGGTWMAIYLAACSLGGIALSVIVPTYILRRVQNRRSGLLVQE